MSSPIVTEAAKRAEVAEKLNHTIEVMTFTVLVLAAILILDVLVEVYRIHERPKDRR